MQFSQPQKLGGVGGNPMGGISIDGSAFNHGSLYPDQFKGIWGVLYEKGVAGYGIDEAYLWVYYDCSSGKKDYRDAYSAHFGNKDKTITVKMGVGEGEYVQIDRVKNDGGIKLFIVAYKGSVVGPEKYVLMGYDKTGKFVKYVDVKSVIEHYLGKNNVGMKGAYLGRYYCENNAVVVEYMDSRITKSYKNAVGEFRFTWNDNAQWFGVEHIIY